MKKFLSLIVLFFLVSLGSALATDLTIDEDIIIDAAISDLSETGAPGDTKTWTVVLDNTGGTDIASVTLSSTTLAHSTGAPTLTAPSLSAVTTILASNTKSGTFSLTVPITKFGTYTATLTATDAANSTNTDTASYTLIVSAVDRVEVTDYDDSDQLVIASEADDSASGTFSIKNTGSTTPVLSSSSFTYTAADFTDGDGDLITLNFTSIPATFGPGDTDSITVTASVDEDMDAGIYEGTVTVTSGSGTDTFLLEVRVQPEVCEDGIVKDGDPVTPSLAFFDLSIEEPDDGDDFEPGDTIKVEVEVSNDNDDDMDVVVVAFLYDADDDNELVSAESDPQTIKDGKKEDFILELDIPFTDVDEDNTYIIYVKAYEDGDEDENCNEASKEISIEQPKHLVVVDDFTITPSSAKAGEIISFTVKAFNVGSSDESDVTVRVLNTELGLDMVSNEFELDEFDGKEDSAIKRFTFTVPKDAQAQEYSIEAVVTFDDGDETRSAFETFTVFKADAPVVELPEVELSATGGTVDSGAALSFPVKVTNNGDKASLTVEVVNVDGWADRISSQSVTLDTGKSTTLYFYLQSHAGKAGKQSATVNIKANGEVVASDTVVFDLTESQATTSEAPAATGATVFSGVDFGSLTSGNNLLWIGADLVLIVVAIFFLKMFFAGKKV